MNETTDRSRQIAEANDQSRKSLIRDRLMITSGVLGLSVDCQLRAMNAIANFDGFSTSNDPYLEHDFGSVRIDGRQIFFKFDYFDNLLECHSPDVLDRSVTRRMLTVMLAEEY